MERYHDINNFNTFHDDRTTREEFFFDITIRGENGFGFNFNTTNVLGLDPNPCGIQDIYWYNLYEFEKKNDVNNVLKNNIENKRMVIKKRQRLELLYVQK